MSASARSVHLVGTIPAPSTRAALDLAAEAVGEADDLKFFFDGTHHPELGGSPLPSGDGEALVVGVLNAVPLQLLNHPLDRTEIPLGSREPAVIDIAQNLEVVHGF